MEIKDLNPKAREAFGKNLVDISLAINKGIILLITIIPLGLVAKTIVEGEAISFLDLLRQIGGSTYIVFSSLLVFSFLVGHYFRKEGLKHIHASEEM